MARSKQPAVKREASSEYFNKDTTAWEASNGDRKAVNGVASTAVVDVGLQKQDAGVVQLFVAVAGIYASL